MSLDLVYSHLQYNRIQDTFLKYNSHVRSIQLYRTSLQYVQPPVLDCSNQETFECVECGHKDNADFNAAKNIRNRVLVTVLRESLLKQLDNGAFESRKLKREKVKEVLLSFRRNLQDNARSECIESSVTTFEYV